MMPASWRDPFGNSFERLVTMMIAEIVNSEPEPFRYRHDMYPPLVVKAAIQRIESARGQALCSPPVPATPEDLVRFECELLAVFDGSSEISRGNIEACRAAIEAIEDRHPVTLARVKGQPQARSAAA